MQDLRWGYYGSSEPDPIGYQDPISKFHNNHNFVQSWFLWKGSLPVVLFIHPKSQILRVFWGWKIMFSQESQRVIGQIPTIILFLLQIIGLQLEIFHLK